MCSVHLAAWASPPGMRRFLKKVMLPAGTKEIEPKPDKTTGTIPSEEGQANRQRIIPLMNEILEGKGFDKIVDGKIFVTGLKGLLEVQWKDKVAAFVVQLPIPSINCGRVSGVRLLP
jgi:hypothetical protein